MKGGEAPESRLKIGFRKECWFDSARGTNGLSSYSNLAAI
jgi:hypothetical protein